MIRLLLFSNSTMPGTQFFTWPRPFVRKFLGQRRLRLLFIPYAAVTISYDEYTQKVTEVFQELGYEVTGIHTVADKARSIDAAEGIIVGGGNTFALLHALSQDGQLARIRGKITGGTPYIGWSAGANVACPTIMTTNDMPVVQPASFNALNLIPFQLNPHYHELKFEGQGGETRKERLEEFLVMNPSLKVLGLPEGMFVEREGDHFWVGGEGVAKLYAASKTVAEIKGGTDVSFLISNF